VHAKIITILDILEHATRSMIPPMSVLLVRDFGRDPFIILISCLLSLRARDRVCYPICKQLFSRIRTPEALRAMNINELEEIIRPIGFYHRKAYTLQRVCAELIERFQGKVPANEGDLLSLYGVGRKTANLVLSEGFEMPGLCVDTHVHKIANRLGLVSTKTPQETEKALKKLVPKKRWRDINRLFVVWGQNKRALAYLWKQEPFVSLDTQKLSIKKGH